MGGGGEGAFKGNSSVLTRVVRCMVMLSTEMGEHEGREMVCARLTVMVSYPSIHAFA